MNIVQSHTEQLSIEELAWQLLLIICQYLKQLLLQKLQQKFSNILRLDQMKDELFTSMIFI